MKHVRSKWEMRFAPISVVQRLQKKREALAALRDNPASMPWFSSQCGRKTYFGPAAGSTVCWHCGNYHINGEGEGK
ncbi:MAG: hypothetical protein ACAH80_18695 [Alphaproteobacteria bacterium]